MNKKKRNKKRKSNNQNEGELSRKVQEIEQQYTIEVLNYHCLGEIISYLGPVDRFNLEKLSEKIKVASNFAWRRIKDLDIMSDSHYETIKQCSIKAGGTQNITKQILVQCGNYLESLHVGACGNPLMSSIVNKCHNLRKLTIEYQFFDCKKFKDAFKNMKNLKYIKLKLSKIDSGILKSLPGDIEEISLRRRADYRKYLQLIVSKDCKNFFNEWKALRSLSLNSLIINETTNVIFNKNYSLTHLDLAYCKYNDIHGTGLLLSNYRYLEHFNLSNSETVNDDLINAIANNFENLKHLNIQACKSISTEGLKELGKLKNLEEIIMNYNIRVDDGVLAKFKNLRILDCNWTSVSDPGVIAILDNSPNLERLHIYGTKITANTLSHASHITNYRERKLVIRATQTVIDDFNGRKEISPFLDLKIH